MSKTKSYPPINALVRGLTLLEEINRLGAPTVGDLHERSGISKSTIVRNLETLEHLGFVARDRDGDGYVVTARVLSLSSGYDRGKRLVQLATPVLNEFRTAMPWPSDLAVFDGEAMVILETSRNPGTLALNRPVGTRLPVTSSALGRAYLAHTDKAERDAILAKAFDASDDQRQHRLALEAELSRYRQQGFSENDQSLSKNTRGIGVPIIVGGEVAACINTIVLSEALSMEEVVERCVSPLQSVAKKIEASLAADR